MDNVAIIYDSFINKFWQFLFINYDNCFKQPFNQIVEISENIVIIYEDIVIIWTKCGRIELRHLGVDVWSESGINVVGVWLTSWLPQQPKHSHNFWTMVRICGHRNRNFWLLFPQTLMIFQKCWVFVWRVV